MASRPLHDVGYASGVFDLFHVGHLNLLRHARALCRHLVVGVAADEYVLDLKGRRPVAPLHERLAIVEAVRLVDEVVVDFSSDKSLAWRRRRFDVVVKGDDWRGTAHGDRLESDMAALGVAVVWVPYTRTTSSTLLRRHLERTAGRA